MHALAGGSHCSVPSRIELPHDDGSVVTVLLLVVVLELVLVVVVTAIVVLVVVAMHIVPVQVPEPAPGAGPGRISHGVNRASPGAPSSKTSSPVPVGLAATLNG